MSKQHNLVAAQLELWPPAEEDLKVLPVPDRWAVLTVTMHNCRWHAWFLQARLFATLCLLCATVPK